MRLSHLIKPPLRALRSAWRAARGRPSPAAAPAPVAPEATPIVPEVTTPPATTTPAVAAPVVTPPASTAPPAEPRPPLTVRVEETPNPDARKFVCSATLQEGPSVAALQGDEVRHPIAAALLDVPGVRSVFLVRDFTTITRQQGVPWATLEPAIRAALTRAVDGAC